MDSNLFSGCKKDLNWKSLSTKNAFSLCAHPCLDNWTNTIAKWRHPPQNYMLTYKMSQYFKYFDTTMMGLLITPVGFTAMAGKKKKKKKKRRFYRSWKTLHPFSTLAAVIILERIDFVTSPFFKSLSLGLMNYVVRIFQNKARSWQVHNTLHDGSDCLQISAGDKRVNKRSDWTLCPWRDVPGDSKASLFSRNPAPRLNVFKKNLRCYIALLSEWLQRESDESATSGLFICYVRNKWVDLWLMPCNLRQHQGGGIIRGEVIVLGFFLTNNHEYERSTATTEVSVISSLPIWPWQGEETRRTKNNGQWTSIYGIPQHSHLSCLHRVSVTELKATT